MGQAKISSSFLLKTNVHGYSIVLNGRHISVSATGFC